MYSKPIALAVFAFAVAGCASTGSQTSSATADDAAATVAASGGAGPCEAGAVQDIVGKAYSERAVQNALQRSGAGSLRLLQPGEVMTMEYNPSRLTVVIDDDQSVALGALRLTPGTLSDITVQRGRPSHIGPVSLF